MLISGFSVPYTLGKTFLSILQANCNFFFPVWLVAIGTVAGSAWALQYCAFYLLRVVLSSEPGSFLTHTLTSILLNSWWGPSEDLQRSLCVQLSPLALWSLATLFSLDPPSPRLKGLCSVLPCLCVPELLSRKLSQNSELR